MIYPENFEQKIGFDRIRNQIILMCATQAAAEKLRNACFITDYEVICRNLDLCDQMKSLLIFNNEIGSLNFVDTDSILTKAEIQGNFLEVEEIVTLRKALSSVLSATSVIMAADSQKYHTLQEFSRGITGFPAIIGHIDSLIDRFGKIKDSASPELYDIRHTLRSREGEVSKRLQRIMAQAQAAGYVDAEATLSVRDGRTVIPVSAANKKKIAGFIHDESATGKTFYIEPVEIVELNNEIRELEYAERREIIKILTAFADTIRPDIDEMRRSGDFLTSLDMIVAKAKHALEHNYNRPIINPTEQIISIRQGRHPILEQTLQREQKQIIPLDLKLDTDNRILVISGPNAGGKSVCLKSVGILQYMLQCGFLVPALDNSEFSLFDSLFIDIGDEQSIDNDLSTYSSRLLNMKNMLRYGNNRSLLLIDEFGSGTEPIMGGALAESMLEKYVEKGCFGVISTHYANIKYFATNTPGVIGGAMMFDVQNIRPLFRLELGKPGSSFAIEIARKTGIPEEIIARATEMAGSDHVNIEKQLREIARDKRYWENKRDRIRRSEKHVDEITARYEKELSEIRTERNRLIKEAKIEAQRITSEANKQIENTIRVIKESQADREQTRIVRRKMEAFKQSIEDMDSSSQNIDRKIEQLRQRAERRAQRSAEKSAEKSEQNVTTTKKPAVIEVGSHVRIKDQQVIGEVVRINGKKATVTFGQISSTVMLNQLVAISKNEFDKAASSNSSYKARPAGQYDTMQKRLTFNDNIDVRGMRVAEALELVEDFIDEAVMFGFNELRILHGKGTGALKEEIRNYLKTTGVVKSAKDEHEEHGGAGITVIKLNI